MLQDPDSLMDDGAAPRPTKGLNVTAASSCARPVELPSRFALHPVTVGRAGGRAPEIR